MSGDSRLSNNRSHPHDLVDGMKILSLASFSIAVSAFTAMASAAHPSTPLAPPSENAADVKFERAASRFAKGLASGDATILRPVCESNLTIFNATRAYTDYLKGTVNEIFPEETLGSGLSRSIQDRPPVSILATKRKPVTTQHILLVSVSNVFTANGKLAPWFAKLARKLRKVPNSQRDIQFSSQSPEMPGLSGPAIAFRLASNLEYRFEFAFDRTDWKVARLWILSH
jgi:hypothetical protein